MLELSHKKCPNPISCDPPLKNPKKTTRCREKGKALKVSKTKSQWQCSKYSLQKTHLTNLHGFHCQNHHCHFYHSHEGFHHLMPFESTTTLFTLRWNLEPSREGSDAGGTSLETSYSRWGVLMILMSMNLRRHFQKKFQFIALQTRSPSKKNPGAKKEILPGLSVPLVSQQLVPEFPTTHPQCVEACQGYSKASLHEPPQCYSYFMIFMF